MQGPTFMPTTLSSIVLLLHNNKLWVTYSQRLILFKQGFFTLNLVLNVEKTKFMWLSNSRNSLDGCCSPNSAGKLIALVSAYKYLGIIIDDTRRFDSYMNYLRLKLKKQLGFYFRHKSCFSFNARKKLVSGTCLPILDYSACLFLSSCLSGSGVSRCFKIYYGLYIFYTSLYTL